MSTANDSGHTYAAAGVDIDAGSHLAARIKEIARSAGRPEVLAGVGPFASLFRLGDYREPVLVASADGVGTKLKVAIAAGVHGTVGQDLVNHCVNDILVQGAEPLFFLDYIASGVLDPAIIADVVTGIARGCTENGCALIGGETAEMPGFYAAGEYDLAGCIIGYVELARVIDGRSIRPGDAVWALPSSGLHTNGYSLARKIVFDEAKLSVDDPIPGTGKSVREALLAVHRSYLPEIRDIRARTEIKGLAHITGGGLLQNIPRILPAGTAVEIDVSAWEVPPLFRFLAERGGVDPMEMPRVFNMGIGMIVIVASDAREAMERAAGRWKPFPVGRVVEGDKKVHLV